MNTRSRSLLTVLLTAALTLTSLPAGADKNNHDRSGSDEGISEQQAASIVKRAYDGRVMSVKREGNRYKVTVLLDGGRIKTVSVDSHGNLGN